jgi:hypothetical protein
VGGLEYPPKCDFKMEDGTDCPIPASHFWGSLGEGGKAVKMCCTHFDLFAPTLFKKPLEPGYFLPPFHGRHIEIVEEYNRQCGRTSLIPGAKCGSND